MPRGIAPEPVLSEVVRQRLAALLAEVPARRAVGPPPEIEDEAPDPEPVAPEPAAARPLPRELVAERLRVAWAFTRSHLVAVGIVLLTGCLWAGYSVLQARSTPVEAPTTAPTVVSSPTPTPTPPARILVHVLGSVARPGVVELPEGARVRDAIAAAGGLTADADPGELNLAAVLTDGTQLIIGDAGRPRGEVRGDGGGQGGGGAGGGQKLSLNSATQAEFETLPGIGPVTAGRIVAWREQHGRFSRIEELQEVDGIGPKTYAQLADLVRL
ncbi:MAG: ComEA family DNA-binding protein [Propionicimonas sp.]